EWSRMVKNVEARMTNDESMTKLKLKNVSTTSAVFRISSFGFPSSLGIRHSSFLVRLHDFADKDVQLPVLLFAHFGDLVRPHFIPAYRCALRRRSIATRKFHNDARRRSAAEVQHFVC